MNTTSRHTFNAIYNTETGKWLNYSLYNTLDASPHVQTSDKYEWDLEPTCIMTDINLLDCTVDYVLDNPKIVRDCIMKLLKEGVILDSELGSLIIVPVCEEIMFVDTGVEDVIHEMDFIPNYANAVPFNKVLHP